MEGYIVTVSISSVNKEVEGCLLLVIHNTKDIIKYQANIGNARDLIKGIIEVIVIIYFIDNYNFREWLNYRYSMGI